MFDLAVSTIAQGLMWSILSLGVFLSFRVLDVPDMTCEGSFPLGGAIAATLITAGVSPWASLAAGAIGGLLAGVVSGILYTKLKIPAILAGILTMIALYSINLHIMGKANISLLRTDTVFSLTQKALGVSQGMAAFLLPTILVILIVGAIYWFFGTEYGCALRATGANVNMARAQGINTNFNIVLGLAVSNGLVALSGALLSQYQGFADVGMGRGAIVIGLAAVIIGEVLLDKIFRNFALKLCSVVVGAVIYYLVLQIVLQLGLNTNDLKLFTAAIVALFLSIPYWKNSIHVKKEKGGARNA